MRSANSLAAARLEAGVGQSCCRLLGGRAHYTRPLLGGFGLACNAFFLVSGKSALAGWVGLRQFAGGLSCGDASLPFRGRGKGDAGACMLMMAMLKLRSTIATQNDTCGIRIVASQTVAIGWLGAAR